MTTSAPASRSAAAHRLALSRKNGSSVAGRAPEPTLGRGFVLARGWRSGMIAVGV